MNAQLRADTAQYAPGTGGKYPDAKGRYGAFGGRFVPETLVPVVGSALVEVLEGGDDVRLFLGPLR